MAFMQKSSPTSPFTLPQPPARGRVYDSILKTIGATPLVRLPRLAAEAKFSADLALKLEFFNPAGSVKDRIALAMIEAAEEAGQLTPDTGDLDAHG